MPQKNNPNSMFGVVPARVHGFGFKEESHIYRLSLNTFSGLIFAAYLE